MIDLRGLHAAMQPCSHATNKEYAAHATSLCSKLSSQLVAVTVSHG